MIVLYVILWAILGLLLLLLLLTLMPVGAELRFDGEFHLRIKYLFLNIRRRSPRSLQRMKSLRNRKNQASLV